MSPSRAPQGDVPTGDGCGDHEGARLDAIWDGLVRGTAKTAAAFDLDGVGGRAFHLGAHGLQELDEVVYLGFAGSWPDDRMAVCQRGRQHRVLGAHHRDMRELDQATTKPPRRLGEVVAVAIDDLGTQGTHGIDMQIDGPPSDTVATRVADDDLPETCQQGA